MVSKRSLWKDTHKMSPHGSGNLRTEEENVKYILVEEIHLFSIFFSVRNIEHMQCKTILLVFTEDKINPNCYQLHRNSYFISVF